MQSGCAAGAEKRRLPRTEQTPGSATRLFSGGPREIRTGKTSCAQYFDEIKWRYELYRMGIIPCGQELENRLRYEEPYAPPSGVSAQLNREARAVVREARRSCIVFRPSGRQRLPPRHGTAQQVSSSIFPVFRGPRCADIPKGRRRSPPCPRSLPAGSSLVRQSKNREQTIWQARVRPGAAFPGRNWQ